VTRHRRALAAAAAATLVCAPAAVAKDNAKPKPATTCKAPDSGFRACLQVRYFIRDDGTAANVRLSATLVRTVKQCPAKPDTRQVVIWRDGTEQLATQKRKSSCRKGLVTWNAQFTPPQTGGWKLVDGSIVDALWSGTNAPTSVTIGKGGGT
jgi:hypothetical protein